MTNKELMAMMEKWKRFNLMDLNDPKDDTFSPFMFYLLDHPTPSGC